MSMKTWMGMGLAACALAGLAVPAAAQAAWVGTATQALPLSKSVATSRLASGTAVHVILSLKLQNPGGLASLLESQHHAGSPAYGTALTPAQFVAQYSPSAAQAQQVADYLGAQGFRNVTVSWNRELVNADGTAAQAEAAFNTTLVQFLFGGKLAYGPTAPAMVPDSLGGVVLSVLGLENLSALSTTTLSQRSTALEAKANGLTLPTSLPPAGYTPQQFLSAYDAGSTPSGAGTVVAISTCCDTLTQVQADLAMFETMYSLPTTPSTVVQSAPLPASLDSGDDAEWDLDSQASSSIAGKVQQIVFYNTTDLGSSLINAYNDFTAPDPSTDVPLAKVGNMSYGGCELLDDVEGITSADDQAFEQAQAQGQTWFAAAGDAGAACTVLFNSVTPFLVGIPGMVEYPASSPYVVAVGGSTLFVNSDNSYQTEIAWTAGGGGTSLVEAAPSWQTGVKDILTANLLKRRAVPDMAMEAGGPNIGVPELGAIGVGGAIIVNDGSTVEVLGTSLSSPLAAGSWARMESAHCNSLGFAAPLLYALNTTPSTLFSAASGFNDIELGTNGLYLATPGWDYTTGYGSFDISKVNAALPAAANCTPAS